MSKIFVYAAQPALANKAVEQLRVAGADQVEVLPELKIPARPSKDNRYLFICETPAEKLSQLVPHVLPEEDYAQTLAQWFEVQYHIVKTAETLKKRAILFSTAQLVNPSELVETINNAWGLSLKPAVTPASSAYETPNQAREPLLGYLVQNLIEQTPPLQTLQNLINALAGVDNEPLHETDALIGYRGLLQQQKELQTQNQNLKSVQEELESIFIEVNAFKEAAAKEKFDLMAALDAQAKATKEATQEAELLLNQLHQVQEELEHYFLKNQETEAKLAKQHARLQRLLEKHPDYIETESVQVEILDPKTKTLKWFIHGLEGQGLSKGYLEFDTFFESGVMGFRFNKTNRFKEPNLKNWPASSEGETIDFIPAGKGNVMRKRAMTLLELSASDWNLVNTLPQLIKQHLNDKALDAKLCASVTVGANKLALGINALPKTFRYDTVTLKSNKVNPDYEHLWFELHNASYDTYYWPKFEFRLGAANIKPGKFSDQPKLEIPLINGKTKPFDSWFEESYDDYGGKYELRFDLKRGITDLETLLKVENRDQKVISALIALLPTLFKKFSENNVNLKRSPEDWYNLALGVNRVANAVV